MNQKTNFYFSNFIESATVACSAAEMLKSVLTKFGLDLFPAQVKQLHEVEHKGDVLRHELIAKITRDFITPIDRDDIIELSNRIDDVTDSIEDIVISIYINNETKIRDDSLEFCDILIKCCMATREMLTEFVNFRKSRLLTSLVAKVHLIEEEGDAMYIKVMKNLHNTVTTPLTVIVWREIYGFFENCCDKCTDVADIVERIAIGNM